MNPPGRTLSNKAEFGPSFQWVSFHSAQESTEGPSTWLEPCGPGRRPTARQWNERQHPFRNSRILELRSTGRISSRVRSSPFPESAGRLRKYPRGPHASPRHRVEVEEPSGV